MMLNVGNIVEHEDFFWDHKDGHTVPEKFTVPAIEEYDLQDPHPNVRVRNICGISRHFDETELEIVG